MYIHLLSYLCLSSFGSFWEEIMLDIGVDCNITVYFIWSHHPLHVLTPSRVLQRKETNVIGPYTNNLGFMHFFYHIFVNINNDLQHFAIKFKIRHFAKYHWFIILILEALMINYNLSFFSLLILTRLPINIHERNEKHRININFLFSAYIQIYILGITEISYSIRHVNSKIS